MQIELNLPMIDSWKSLTQDNKIKIFLLLISTIASIVIGKNWLDNRDDSEPALTSTYTASQGGVIQTGDGINVANTGSGTINIGITATEFVDELKRREAEVRAELEQKHSKDSTVLEAELLDIQQQLQNITASYEARTNSLKERIAQLEAVRGEYPDSLLDEAITALQQGDSKQADALFKQIEEENENNIKLVAEAAYQRGKIAQDAIRYLDALNHYEKAVRLAPDNSLYLNDAGIINQKLAYFKKAIDYFEQALGSDLKTYGEDHPDVAASLNNLAELYRVQGQYAKAEPLFKQSLAIYEKALGPDHPDVAVSLNNLGELYRVQGQYAKAEPLFKQSWAILEKARFELLEKLAIRENALGGGDGDLFVLSRLKLSQEADEHFLMSEFPWPPPRSSAMKVIPDNFFRNVREVDIQLADVDTRINNALDASGYVERSYYAVPGGFALVTRLEKINSDGTPKLGADRWASEVGPLRLYPFDVDAYIKALFTSNPGFFRIIVFIVTPHPFTQTDEIVNRQDAISWLHRGSNKLPYELGIQPYTYQYSCTVLIYEFEKIAGKQAASTVLPGKLSGKTHLEKSKLWLGLNQ